MKQCRYKLDNSGIIHLASLRKGHSNSFRISAVLHKTVDPVLLQQALNALVPRFPTIAAGIRPGLFHYYVVPVDTAPTVQPDTAFLRPMTYKELQQCAIRVFYRDRELSVETFHSITDGYGGTAFFNALLAEYLRLSAGANCSGEPGLITPDTAVSLCETEDSFRVYDAGQSKAPFRSRRSYQLLGTPLDVPVHSTVVALDLRSLLDIAHRFGVTLTTLLTAVMVQAVLDVQRTHTKSRQPVQLMVPADLRRIFPSKTLRNFSLYALPSIQPDALELPFEQLLAQVSAQLRTQLSPDALGAMISTNQLLDRYLFWVPLKLKLAALRLGFHFLGERTSTLTLSNLGRLHIPQALQPHIEQISTFLTPRICSGYNCVGMTLNGQLRLFFTRRSKEPMLEECFVRRLQALGATPQWQHDGGPPVP